MPAYELEKLEHALALGTCQEQVPQLAGLAELALPTALELSNIASKNIVFLCYNALVGIPMDIIFEVR